MALFVEHLPSKPSFIIGQIVHIERLTVRLRPEQGGDQVDHNPSPTGTHRLALECGSLSNPYNLPIGCEYFIVTVAMLPDTTIHSPPS